ncbi:MAG: carbohydrate ABC transporter permease [Marvinbryantia sp.]|uniref:carbohydrate ABC transporter permease n=1 Tax=Marvinbryantia sp. TaxID=2496532 RepID=UPI0025F91D91|nr:carbohydrate ABC transporter permease [uncultured Marvinbryantia sp.]
MDMKQKRLIGKVVKFMILGLFLIVVMFPFYWMLVTSLKGSQAEIYAFPVKYLPEKISWVNYVEILWKGNFIVYMRNSLVVSTIAAFFASIIGICAGYVLSRFKFRMKNLLLLFFLITQMVPTFIMLPALYQMLSSLHMTNNIWTMALLYTNMMIPFSVVTLRSFFDGIPNVLEEAAWIDGCGYGQGLVKIIVPLMKPGIAATFIFAFINSWNELFMAIMFIDKDSLKTIPVGLNGLILKYDIKWGEMAAGTILALIPTIILFSFAQKYMIEGLTAGSVKG